MRRRSELALYLPAAIVADELAAMKRDAVCALTGSTKDVTLDHFIPVAWGHGGLYPGNLFMVKRELNVLKSSRNPFRWINGIASRDDVSLQRWERLLARLAEENGLSVRAFRSYVNWCERNKRSVGQLKADPRPSLELWKETAGVR